MSVIEFLGLPRAGKSTLVSRIQGLCPEIVVHHETFESASLPGDILDSGKRYEYNFLHLRRIAAQVALAFQESRSMGSVHIVERGLLDRTAFFQALVNQGLISSIQHAEASSFISETLADFAVRFGVGDGCDRAYLFNPTLEISLERIKRLKPGNIMQDRGFLEALKKEYDLIQARRPNVMEAPVITYQNVDKFAKDFVTVVKSR